MLGVVMLDAHAALPEHHHVNGTETICVASLAVATLAMAAWALGSIKRTKHRRRVQPQVRWPCHVSLAVPGPCARAGPAPPVVLRR